MRSNSILYLVAVAVFFLGAMPALSSVAAQGMSSLGGTVCIAPESSAEGDGVASPPYYPDGMYASCLIVPNATLRLQKTGVGGTAIGAVDRSATADENGAFTIANLADGTYSLTTTHLGFAAKTEEVKVQGATKLDVNLKAQDVVVPGTVVTPDGKPIGDVRVSYCCHPENAYNETRTASNGAFQLHVRAGHVSFSVGDASGYNDAYVQRFVDGTPIEVELTPLPPPVGFVAGRVTNQDGAPVAGLRVSAYSYGNYGYGGTADPACKECSSVAYAPTSGSNHTLTDAQGRYRIGVLGENVDLSVYQEGYTSYSRHVTVERDSTLTHDFQVLVVPGKTAQVTGRIVDARTGAGIAHASLSSNNPLYGVYACSAYDDPARNTAQDDAVATDAVAASEPAMAPASSAMIARPGYGYDASCDITVHADGTFDGKITPGYTILNVWIDSYAACADDADQKMAPYAYTKACAPEYFAFTLVVDLVEGANNLTLRVVPRPVPDAAISGYVVDASTAKAIPNVQVSVSSEENGGYGYAITDKDGSYKIGVRSGYFRVSVYADGFLPWEGMLDVDAGDNAFDIVLTPGQAAGYCCFGPVYALDKSAAGGATPATSPAPSVAEGASGVGNDGASSSDSATATFADLGGGLGPYDPAARSKLASGEDGSTGDSKSSPAWALFGTVAALAAMALAARRRLA